MAHKITCRAFLEVIFFRVSLGEFGQKFFAPPKICLLLHLCHRLMVMVDFPLPRIQSFFRNDLLRGITIASLCCNVLKVHFDYLLHPPVYGTTQSYLIYLAWKFVQGDTKQRPSPKIELLPKYYVD